MDVVDSNESCAEDPDQENLFIAVILPGEALVDHLDP